MHIAHISSLCVHPSPYIWLWRDLRTAEWRRALNMPTGANEPLFFSLVLFAVVWVSECSCICTSRQTFHFVYCFAADVRLFRFVGVVVGLFFLSVCSSRIFADLMMSWFMLIFAPFCVKSIEVISGNQLSNKMFVVLSTLGLSLPSSDGSGNLRHHFSNWSNLRSTPRVFLVFEQINSFRHLSLTDCAAMTRRTDECVMFCTVTEWRKIIVKCKLRRD